MTVTIELTSEEAEKVQFQADRNGVDIGEYFRQMLHRQPLREKSLQETLSPDEWIRVSHEWLDTLPKNLPVLTDEEMSRESIYGDAH